MSRRALRGLLAVLLAVPAGAALAAPVQLISDDATLHRVEATFVGKPGMPVLRHTAVLDDGSSVVSIVPGTADVFMDREPALSMDPIRGTPVLAWSRDTGSGFDIYVSRYDQGSWSLPVRAIHQGVDAVRPQVQVSGSLVHVVAGVGDGYLRVSLDRGSLEPAFGPEQLPTDVAAITPGVDPAVSVPGSTHLYFASDVLHPVPGEPGRVVIWGVRDEPVPIDYVQAMLLPEDFESAVHTQAMPIEGSLTLTVASDTQVWYTLFRDTAWLGFSSLSLDATMTMSDVRSMLADLIRRAP